MRTPHPPGQTRRRRGCRPAVVRGCRRGRRHDARAELTDEAISEIRRGRAIVEALAGDEAPHYGISTGFGALATRFIPPDRRAALQRSLIRSHAAGAGAEVEREVVRAMLLLRLSTLATGRTGVRVETAATYASLLNAGITPVVHEHGSLGCSGDLAPLAHCALAAMGEGTVRDTAGGAGKDSTAGGAGKGATGGQRRDAADALAEAGITPLTLTEKEGWLSSTAPTACSACSSSPSRTCGRC